MSIPLSSSPSSGAKVGRLVLILSLAAPMSILARPHTTEPTTQAPSPLSEADFLASAGLGTGDVPATTGLPLAALLEEEPTLFEAERLAHRRLPDPELSFESETAGDERERGWRLRWAPPLDGRRRPLLDAAEAGIAAARERSRILALEMRFEMRSVYAAWALAERRHAVLEEHTERLRQLASTVGRQAEAGETSGLDARRFALAAQTSARELARAEADRAMTREAARGWYGDLPADAGPTLALHPLPTPANGERPDLAALRFEVERGERLLAASRRWLGAPTLELGWKEVDPGPSDFEGSQDGGIAAIGWTIPLFGRRQDERLAAEARLESSEARLELARRRAGAELEGARRAYQRLLEAARGDAGMATHETTMVEAGLTAYRLGEGSATDLLSTFESVKTARLSRLELLAAAHRAHRNLERATGFPLTLANETPQSPESPTAATTPGDLP